MPPYQGSISESSGAMPPPAVSDGPVLEGGSPLRDPAASSLPCFDSRPLKAVAVGPWQATPVVSGISHPDTPRPTSAEEGVAALAPSSGNSVSVGSTITEHYAVGLPILEVSGNLSSEEREARVNSIIQEYKAKLQFRTQHHMGYPYNLDFDYGPLEDLSKFSINNLGDPFIESNYGVHSREFEVGVLEWFAKLWDIDQEGYWGYITNCGTEGNLHGILVGRENFPDGILYTSKETHYSVPKAARMYRMDLVEVGGSTHTITHAHGALKPGAQLSMPTCLAHPAAFFLSARSAPYHPGRSTTRSLRKSSGSTVTGRPSSMSTLGQLSRGLWMTWTRCWRSWNAPGTARTASTSIVMERCLG